MLTCDNNYSQDFKGPRGELFSAKKICKAIDKAIFPGIQGGPLMHIIAAKAVSLGEALQDSLKIIKSKSSNAKALASSLADKGIRLYQEADNH